MGENRVKKGIVFAAFFVCAACAARGAAFTPVPFNGGANASFRDELAEDRKGGFIDLGGHDLRALPSGFQVISGIPFNILPSPTSEDKACIVLGGPKRDYLPRKAEVKLQKPAADERLYLLHGCAFLPSKGNPIAGTLNLAYEDGRKESRHVRIGRDVGDWTRAKSYVNAARAWTVYNNNTQVSLFISSFPLARGRKLASVSFESGEGTWMVAAATVGSRRTVRPIMPDVSIKRQYDIPALYEHPLPALPAGAKPRNVVFVLGDGMGQGALSLASFYLRKHPGALVTDQLPYAALVTTFSADADVTDSAASATAFATGHKTNNSMLGMRPDGTHVRSIAVCAREAGFAVGLLTDDPLNGATPAAYYAHAPIRSAASQIAKDAAACGFEILLGYGCKEWFLPKEKGGARRDGRDLFAEMTANGYAYAKTFDALLSVPMDKRVLACLKPGELDREPLYKPMMENTFARLSQGGKRFFVMVESGDPDHGAHANKPELAISGVVKIEWAVRAAVDFSLSRGNDTLVVVMADHETGAVTAVGSPATGKVSVNFGSTGHTGAPVPLHAFGPGAECFEGVIDSTDVPKRLAKLLDLKLE